MQPRRSPLAPLRRYSLAPGHIPVPLWRERERGGGGGGGGRGGGGRRRGGGGEGYCALLKSVYHSNLFDHMTFQNELG